MEPNTPPTQKEFTIPHHLNRVPRISRQHAANLVRNKLAKLYEKSPDTLQETIEAVTEKQPSKHQRYMLELAESGKSLSEIQQAWHNYYMELPDDEKHQVWREFYASQNKETQLREQLYKKEELAANGSYYSEPQHKPAETTHHKRIATKQKLTAKHHLKSALFGLSFGFLFLFIFLFSFFNERFIAPFISPSRNVSATPIIIDPNQPAAVGPEPKVIIPKINLEAPAVYGTASIDENEIQKGLEEGIIHYPNTAVPGQNGNAVYFGHSSNNILNKGKYKFVFVLLHKVEVGDTYMLNYQGKQYVYKVINRKIVSPSEVSVLLEQPKPAISTLITCDPPGTSNNRLIVQGEQISPSPSNNAAAPTTPATAEPQTLPGNAPSLWSRFIHWLF